MDITITVMMVLLVILTLKLALAVITATFIHAKLPPEEQVYIFSNVVSVCTVVIMCYA